VAATERGPVVKREKRQTLDQVVTALSRAQVLQGIAQLQRRQAQLTMMQDLLQNELHRRLSGSATTTHQDEWLTVKDVARELRLARGYIYELLRQGELRAMKVPGEKGYLRVSRDSVNAFVKENLQKSPDL
jgi:excisionase family DNA binding protein